jgi:ankyrin repeat protein
MCTKEETMVKTIELDDETMTMEEQLVDYASVGDLEEVERLLDLGADIHVDSDNALCNAILNGHFNVVKALIERGANIYNVNKWILSDAKMYGYTEIVNYLKSIIKADNEEDE